MRTLFAFFLFAATVGPSAAQTAPVARPPRPARPARRPPTPLADLPPMALLPPFELFAAPLPPLGGELVDRFELLPPILPLSGPDWPVAFEPAWPPLEPGWPSWGDESSSHRALRLFQPEQGTPEDSLYRQAREALNRGEYARASVLFRSLEQKFPRSRVAPAALYYRAFALYRAGGSEDLRSGLEALRAQQERYPDAAADPDAATLRTRLYAALAARGDAQAASALRAATTSGAKAPCDREDIEVRAEALNALAQIDPPEAAATLKKVLARRDECSAGLRRRAVYILGRSGTDQAATDLLEVAKNDPDPGVRSDAIMLIARSPGAATVKTLEQLFNESTDERTRQAALSALRAKGTPDAKRALRSIIEKGDLPERVRAEAVLQLASSGIGGEGWSISNAGQPMSAARRSEGGEEDAAFLRGLYAKTDGRTVKAAILSAVARIGGTANEQWLLGIAKNREEDVSLRREALSRIRTSSLSIEDLGKLFDALSERELRYAVVSQLASRDDPAAVDKLIEIARSGTDPEIRRQAIGALARKKDPRTTKLLLDLLEKP